MKQRFSDVYVQLFIAATVSFLVLSSVTLVTFYRLLLLETEVNLLKGALGVCHEAMKTDKSSIENHQYLPKQRRSISEDIHNYNNLSNSLHIHKAMKYNDSSYAVKKSFYKSLDAYTSNEYNIGNLDSEDPIVRDEAKITRSTRQRMQNLDERHPRTGRIKPLPSIHLSGDTSKYVLGTHQNFNGNGHLRHTQDIFVDWKPNNWVEKTGMMTHFGFDEGYLTIKESGLYLIYAQIYYLDVHDRNGYIVHKNRIPILQCTIDLHTSVRVEKGNTCYTAGVEYVAEGDKISLNDVVGGHYSLFEPGKSFFGAVKLGDIRARI